MRFQVFINDDALPSDDVDTITQDVAQVLGVVFGHIHVTVSHIPEETS